MRLYRNAIIGCLFLAAGCVPKAKQFDNSQNINSGVNIVPEAVLASEKMLPSTKPSSTDVPDLVDIISDSDQPHYKMIELLRTAGLVPMLQQVGPYTVLAPTDDAFSKLPPGTFDQLLLPSRHDQLLSFVKYHLLKGRIDADAMRHTNGQVPTLDGRIVVIKGVGDRVMVKDANIIRTDAAASNGAVHWLDNVLIPPA